MDYCPINTLERSNKFFINNWFCKTIIKKNKDKVKLSANATLNKFLKETIALNIISLAKIREIIVRENDFIHNGNHHSTVNNTVSILKLILLPIKGNIFEK